MEWGFAFKEWMAEVDVIIADKFGGLTHEDLEDYNWYSAFEDGLTPEEVVDEFIDYYSKI